MRPTRTPEQNWRVNISPGRNDPCPCGSGRKYKRCHGASEPGAATAPSAPRLQDQAARHRQAGRAGEALQLLRQAAALAPQDVRAAFELGNLLLESGRPDEALVWLARAAALKPSAADLQTRHGIALEQLGRYGEAVEAHRRAVALAPRAADARLRLATALLVQDQRAAASEQFREAASLSSGTAQGALAEAYGALAEGRTADAEAAAREVVRRDPGRVAGHALLGRILAEAGKADQAFAAFEQVVRLDPRAAGHYYDLARIRRLDESDRPMLAAMRAAAERTDLHVLHRIMLDQALGKAHADLGEYELAMRHFRAASRRKAAIRPLDRAMITERVDRAIATFTPDFFANNEVQSPSAMPILILGMPRSGTTLVESILARHSQVGAGGEIHFWNRRAPSLLASPDAAAMRDAAEAYPAVLREMSDAAHVTDKKPDNFFWAGLIHALFPGARILHCRRDPLDTCVSILANFFAPRPDFSTEPGDLLFYYRHYERVMAHWRAVLPKDRFLEISYERLAENPEPEIRRLVSFCGLDWEDACLTPERSERSVSSASLWQVRQPIFTSSIGAWRRYEPWLGELKALAHVQA